MVFFYFAGEFINSCIAFKKQNQTHFSRIKTRSGTLLLNRSFPSAALSLSQQIWVGPG